MKRQLIKITLALLVLFCAVGFVACGNSSENNSPVKLSSPTNFKTHLGKLTWDSVENAKGYIVKIGATTEEITENTYPLPTLTSSGSKNITVKAIGDGKNIQNQIGQITFILI